MGIKEWFVGKEKVINDSILYTPELGYDEVNNSVERSKVIEEQFKGEVEQKKVKWPNELGEEHPFDFRICEELYKKFGFLTAVIDKYVDFVVGPGFYIECKDERAKEIIEQFMQDVQFNTFLRAWCKEGLLKGNGYAELGGGKNEAIKGIKVLNANYMYNDRDEFGVVKKYKQYRGAFNKFDRKQVVDFEPWEIAHFNFNTVGDCAYGLGITYPALTTINNLLRNEKDLHMLISRKANSPYHIKLGGVFGGKYYKPNVGDITKIGKELEYQTNKLEWTTDGLTDIKVVDFGNIGSKFDAVMRYDLEMLFYIFQIPAVVMGMANVAEGLAQVQMDAFERRVQAIQEEMEKVIEEQIFKRILNANEFDIHVEFQWGQPSDTQKMDRLAKLQTLMSNFRLSESLFKLMEKDVVKLLDYNEDEYEMMSEEEEKKRELERSQPLVPGENESKPQPIPKENIPQPKPTKEHYELQKQCDHCEEKWENINDVQEWLGFNYKSYLGYISQFIKKDDFENLRALNEIEEAAGYFDKGQINELKKVLNTGLMKGQSIKEISKNIDLKVKPRNLYVIGEDGKLGNLVRNGGSRSMMIARTEITRVANAGAIQEFKDAGVEKVRWVASAGNRTCEICEGLNGMIFEIGGQPEIPAHANCRCTVMAVTTG